MKALFLHANKWASVCETPSERIGDCPVEELEKEIVDEETTGEGPPMEIFRGARMEECLVVFFQVEKHDTEEQVNLLCKDIKKISIKVRTSRLVIECFAHLSHSRPDPTVAKTLVMQVLETCKNFGEYEIKTSPFGWNKRLILDVKGHQDAFKHRSY